MAIYHCSVKTIGRSSGRSSVGASAYRSGEKLYNQRDGLTHDYTRKTGVTHTEVMTPSHAPEWANNREKLWNEVEKIEKAKNSQLAREVEVAIPKELSKENQIELIREYTKENFVNKGMVADVSIHDKGDGNPHAHILLTMRPFQQNGSWGAKAKKEYILDKQGEKIKLPSGEYKSRKISSTDWDKKETLETWRENWAKQANKYLEREGHKERIDHRSYKEQGIEKLPTIHLGQTAHQLEKKGIATDRGNINREVEEFNMNYQRDLENVEKMLRDIQLQQQQALQQQMVAEKMPGGGYQNPGRANEQATREIQKSEGLSRVEYGFAKADELEYKTKNSPTQAQAPDKLENFKYEQPERIAENIHHLKTEYINLERQIQSQSKNSSDIRESQQQIDNRIERISQSYKDAAAIQERINSLKDKRADLGIFKAKEKKQIDQQITSLEKSKHQAINNFERTFDIKINQTVSEVKRLKEQSQAIQQQREKLPNTDILREQQKAIERQYKEQKVLLDMHPEKGKIENMVIKNQLNNQSKEQPNFNELTMKARAESKLNNISNKEKYAILKDIAPDKAKEFAKETKQQSFSKER